MKARILLGIARQVTAVLTEFAMKQISGVS